MRLVSNSGSLHTCLNRRNFLRASAALAGTFPFLSEYLQAAPQSKLRAAIIGHTGHGNYGHDHDLIFNGRTNITVVGLADADEAGRTKAATRTRALRAYANYREMLQKEEPNLVCIAPRWTDEHHAMAMAALEAGAHLYVEKPFTQTLAEADEILAEAEKRRRKIVVAHQMRLAPNIVLFKQSLDKGLIGDLLEIRTHGKQDHRAGGEDLIVLGVHLFDLMRFFAGDPLWCSARVLQDGHEITLADARSATEGIGPVAGNDLKAEFAFPNGASGTFVSRAKYRESAGPWGMELLGSKGSAKILMEMIPRIYVLEAGGWTGQGRADHWRPWQEDPTLRWPESEKGLAAANGRVVDEWLAAIQQDREPSCGGLAATKALEMAMAVIAAGLSRSRVQFPLARRQHPLHA